MLVSGFLADLVGELIVRLVGWLVGRGLCELVVRKPRLSWLLLGVLPGAIAALAIYLATGELSLTAVLVIALAAAPVAVALRWAARQLW
ncbi:hypothetical protein [Azospirillum canadense]|uniref:hypothetical protein n=1 Tax=Azospirillum canadense TaxID=403962 RepID=UPI0022272DEC|nr:hypothetical protein [Azospirillum canadense]MCW2236102.1 hypothetical protein [Azospirillum canadense]